jgi:hypothetical protein
VHFDLTLLDFYDTTTYFPYILRLFSSSLPQQPPSTPLQPFSSPPPPSPRQTSQYTRSSLGCPSQNIMAEEKVRTSGDVSRPADAPVLPTVNPDAEKKPAAPEPSIPAAVYVM